MKLGASLLWLFLIYSCGSRANPLRDFLRGYEEPEALDLSADLSSWMTNLPDAVRRTSIAEIAIPGSHDSFTSEMTSSSDVSPDAEEILKELEPILGSLLKQVMVNWSRTQSYLATGQLERGIRYFDLRIAPKDNVDDLFIVHGLYASSVQPILVEINTFLDSHPQEVVILDFQHFYSFTDSTHSKLIEMITSTLGSKLMPFTSDISSVTLESMAGSGYQVITIYREDSVLAANAVLWSTSYFPNPWADTTDTDTLIAALDSGLQARDTSKFFISQCVLTPSAEYILDNPLSTLKKKCAQDFQDTRLSWIGKQSPGNGKLNIIIADFIDLDHNKYVKDVINRNENLTRLSFWQRLLRFRF